MSNIATPNSQPDTEDRVKPHLPTIAVETTANGNTKLTLGGKWYTSLLGKADVTLDGLAAKQSTSVEVDTSAVGGMDTAGVWLLKRFEQAIIKRGYDVSFVGLHPEHKILFDVVAEATGDQPMLPVPPKRDALLIRFLEGVGRAVYGARRDVGMGLHILGAAIIGSQMKEGHSNPLSITPIIAQIDKTGVRAIPIVLLISTIIGAIIAQQGAFQLRYFGAEIFVVDLVSILVLREIGVLITAIMIAGRSGSSITAEIGSMRMREEVDALTVIGLNPIAVLVFPRLVALFISLTLLTFLANLAALGGAMVVADLYSGISYDAFITRMREAIDMSTFAAGLIKAPFMAVIIGVIASIEGMKVGGSAESLGTHVTASVVKSIFVVIVVDGLFAIFFAAIDF